MNAALFPQWRALAREAGCTPAQLALSWLLSQGEHVVPIPGTTDPGHLHDDLGAADLRIDSALLDRANTLIGTHSVAGARYAPGPASDVDTETFEEAG